MIKDYFKIEKRGRQNYYIFSDYQKFEPFSYDFLDKEDLTFTEKAYIIASQQYMFKDEKGIGKISYTNSELSEKINMPESTISKCNRSLTTKEYLSIIRCEKHDPETGLAIQEKIFHLMSGNYIHNILLLFFRPPHNIICGLIYVKLPN